MAWKVQTRRFIIWNIAILQKINFAKLYLVTSYSELRHLWGNYCILQNLNYCLESIMYAIRYFYFIYLLAAMPLETF